MNISQRQNGELLKSLTIERILSFIVYLSNTINIYILGLFYKFMEAEKTSLSKLEPVTTNDVKELIVKEEKLVNKIPETNVQFIDVLKLFSPGTSMRTALDDIMHARMGALVVVDEKGLSKIVDGGFKVNCEFSSQRLVELAKMDGAIILSKDLRKIICANTTLVPKIGIKSKETGTRHKAAERTSKQIKTIVVAVSERKNKITLYFGDEKYVLENTSEILRRATETLQILEKQKEIFNDLVIHLNISEITNTVSISDVCSVLQRMEIIRKISDIVKRYLVELGKEGVIVSMRLKELTTNLEKEKNMILEDYFKSDVYKVDEILHNMNFDFLLETSNISRILFEELYDKLIPSHGFRILNKTNLLEREIITLLDKFGTLDKIFDASRESLIETLKNESVANSFFIDLENLREKIMNGKKV